MSDMNIPIGSVPSGLQDAPNGLPQDTLCWRCKHSVPTLSAGCSWSRHGTPVDGWTAYHDLDREYTYFRHGCYKVISCPKFEPDTNMKMNGTLNAYRGLGYAIATQCVRDYREYYGQLLDDGDWFDLCIKRRKQYIKVREWVYGKRQRAKRRGNKKMYEFLGDKKHKLKKRYEPYKKGAERGYRARQLVKSCEHYFHTEEWLEYCDMDGDRVMKLIQEDVIRQRKEKHGREREV